MQTANASDAEADVDGVVADGGCLHLHRRRPTGLHYVEAAVISPTWGSTQYVSGSSEAFLST